MEPLILDLNSIFILYQVVSVCIGLYSYFVIHKIKLGFFTVKLFTSEKDMKYINSSAYIFPLVFSIFFILADTILWLVRWDTVVILINLGLKIILYKLFEWYYIVKSRHVFNEIHRYYPRFTGTRMIPLAAGSMIVFQTVLLFQFSMILVAAAAVAQASIMYYLHKNKRYSMELIAIKLFEASALIFVFFQAHDYGHPIAYAALIGLLVII